MHTAIAIDLILLITFLAVAFGLYVLRKNRKRVTPSPFDFSGAGAINAGVKRLRK